MSTMKGIVSILFLLLNSQLFAQFDLKVDNAGVDFKFVEDNTRGTMSGVRASIVLDWEDVLSSTISGSVEVKTLDTGNKMRDKHLKSDDFFDVENYPTMKFTSDEVYKKGELYFAKGTLTIKDTEKDVDFRIENADSNLYFTTSIYSSDFGVSVKKKREKNLVEVTVTIPLTQ